MDILTNLAKSDIIDYIFYLSLQDIISLTRVNTHHYNAITEQIPKFMMNIQRTELTLPSNIYFIECNRNDHYHDNDDRGRKLIRKMDIPYYLQSNEKILYRQSFQNNSQIKQNVITLLQSINPYDLFINENYRNIIDCTDGHDVTILITSYNKYLNFSVFYSENYESENKQVLLASITGSLSLLNLLYQNNLHTILNSIGNLHCYSIEIR